MRWWPVAPRLTLSQTSPPRARQAIHGGGIEDLGVQSVQQSPQPNTPHTALAGGRGCVADCALRDYYVARSATAGLVWVYCERLGTHGTAGQGPACWYLHGLFA